MKTKKHRKKNESNKVTNSCKYKIVFGNNENKVQEVISNPPKVQGGRQVKEGQKNIIFNNIDKSNVVRGKSNLEGVTEKMITPQEHSAYTRRIRYKRPSIREQRNLRALHEENAQQRAEVNTLGNSKDGNLLAQLLEKLSK